jgi:hypothetical protein
MQEKTKAFILLMTRVLLVKIAGRMNRLAIFVIFLSPLLLISPRAQAKTITLGEIELSGTFTLNPVYNFNQPTAEPFGSFSDLIIVDASGIFTPLMHKGNVLIMSTPFVLSPPFSANILDKPLAGQMVWSIGGYTIDTTWSSITGADFAGRNVLGLFDLSGHHVEHRNGALGTHESWNFIAPPYDISHFTQPVTGPITLTISETFDTGNAGRQQLRSQLVHAIGQSDSPLVTNFQAAFNNDHIVPEASSLLLLSYALLGFGAWRFGKYSILRIHIYNIASRTRYTQRARPLSLASTQSGYRAGEARV